jgi:hypothetical protein
MKRKLGSFHIHIRDRLLLWLTLHPITRLIFGNSWSLLFNRAVTRKIISYYDGDSGHQINLKTGSVGFGFIHYALILNMRPKRVLCIGSRKGFIPAICALACKENGFGRVDFVDAGYGQNDIHHWSGISWWKRVDPEKHFSLFDVNRWLTTYVMTTEKFAKRYRRSYDYIYVDADHSYAGAKRDWELFWPRLTRGGLIAYHDVAVHQTKALGTFGVWKVWKEKAKNKGLRFAFPAESGLGILQKL